MIRRGESTGMLAVMASEKAAQCFIVRRMDDVSGEPISGVEEVIGITERMPPLAEMIEALTKS